MQLFRIVEKERKRKFDLFSMYCFYTAENECAHPNFGKLGSYC